MPQKNQRSAFTLVETLAALVIFSVAIVAFIQGMGAALGLQADLAQRRRASMLAENIMEEIKYSGDVKEGTQSGRFEGDDATFAWRSEVETTSTPDLMRVTVSITWGSSGKEKSHDLTTLMLYQQSEAKTSSRVRTQ